MSQKIKEILLAILTLIILVGLGFLVMKYVKLPGKKTNEVVNTEMPKATVVTGKVVSVGSGLIEINNGKENVVIKLDDKTVSTKAYMDPVMSKRVPMSLSDIMAGDTVQIVLTPESKETNLIAKSVNMTANSFKTGNISSITNDKIIVNDNITKEEYRFNLSNETLYYRQIDVKPGEPYQPDTISFNDLKTGDLIIVFYVDSLDKNNITAEKILLVPIKEEIESYNI